MTEPIKNAFVWVAGGREYDNHQRIYDVLSAYHNKHGIRRIVTGGASGADYWGGEWAEAKAITLVKVFADWDGKGKPAGPIRNERIATDEKPDVLIAFPGGQGTDNAIKVARLHGIHVFEIDASKAANTPKGKG